MLADQDTLESRMLGKLARPVWGWGPGAIPGPTPLFVGSRDSGDRTAVILTVIASAHRHDLDVWAYLRDILLRLAEGEDDLEALLPDVWKANHPEHVRVFRDEERQSRADQRRYRAAKRRLQAMTS